MDKYDYLIVGAGLFGACFAYRANKSGKKCLVIDKRKTIAGNLYTENVEGINVHKYGAHIFHTSNKEVWEFVNRFTEFNNYINSPVANYKGELYNLPFNMNTFYQMWGCKTPAEARAIIDSQRKELMEKLASEGRNEAANLEEQAIMLVGKDIYEKLIKSYTEKQWGRPCYELPAFIIRRLPLRFVFDNNYFRDNYQGIPKGGYTRMVESMLEGVEVRLDTDFFENRDYFENIADKIVFTGKIDEFYGYKFGRLEYRTVKFEEEIMEVSNYQGNAVINYTDADSHYTRIIEHKHFEYFGEELEKIKKTVISREYSIENKPDSEPYYPINDARNTKLYSMYKTLADAETKVIFGGRLAEYKYYDMAPIVYNVLKMNI